jgi:polyhydroxyalkanoate synthesis regulator phasin
MQDAWRAYLELALGLTETSKRKAQQVVRKLVGQSGATAAQLQALAEELVSTSAANRESLAKLVRSEVDRALGVLGLATADEVAELRNRVSELERKLAEAQAVAAARSGAGGTTEAGSSVSDAALAAALDEVTAAPAPAAKKVAKKAVAKKAVAKKAVAKATKKTVAKTTGKTVTPQATDEESGR